MTEAMPDTPAAQPLRARLYEQFELLLRLVEPEAVELYGLSWALLASHVNQRLGARQDIQGLLGGNALSVMHTNHACHAHFIHAVCRLRSERCFVEVVVWVYRSYLARGFAPGYFPLELAAWQEAIQRYLTPKTPTQWLLAFYEAMMTNHEAFLRLSQEPEPAIPRQPPFFSLVERFLEALLSADEQAADILLQQHLRSAAELPHWWEHVVTPALRLVGQMWSDGQVSVAQEHLATAIAQRVMTRHFPRLPQLPPRPGPIAVVVAAGEEHNVGAAMVRDSLQLYGYQVLYTGANTPADGLVPMLRHNEVQVLLISTTLAFNLPQVMDLIREVRTACGDSAPHIIVGGQAYQTDPKLWQTVGADAQVTSLDALSSHLEAYFAAY